MSHAAAESTPPVTGDAAVDAVTAGLADLDERPLAEHHERLAAVHEQLHAELSRDADPGTPGG